MRDHDLSIAEGDLVANRMTAKTRHTGRFEGIAATNRAVTFASMWMYRIVDRQIVEIWIVDEDFVAKL